MSGSADQVPEWPYGAGGPTVSGAAGDRDMLERQHRPRPFEMPSANTFVAACAIPFMKFLGRIGLQTALPVSDSAAGSHRLRGSIAAR